MNLLADTHVLIWMLGSPETLSENAAAALDADQNTVFFSHVSVWELEIKVSRGRLKMPSDWVDCLREMGLVELPFASPTLAKARIFPGIIEIPLIDCCSHRPSPTHLRW